MTGNYEMDSSSNSSRTDSPVVTGFFWWIMLAVAVMAVPAFGFIASLMVPSTGYGRLLVFILACWTCTYMGIYLMKGQKHPK